MPIGSADEVPFGAPDGKMPPSRMPYAERGQDRRRWPVTGKPPAGGIFFRSMTSVKTLPLQRRQRLPPCKNLLFVIAFSLDIRNNDVYEGFAR